jgi:putative membrane protein
MKRFVTFGALAALLLVWRVNPMLAASPADFLGQAMECNAYEQELAQIAAENATNPDVKAFAQRLGQEHNKFAQELQQVAKEKKIGVVTGTDKEHRDRVADLKKTGKGNDFDKKFLQFVIEDHEKAIKHIEECSKDSGFDSGCKACADKALPALRKHVEEARALQKKMGG